MLDEAILASRYASPNRTGFLLESLTDLRHSLRGRGADLVVRRVDPVRETMALVDQSGANTVFASADVSAFAQRRERRLTAACRSAGVAHRGFPGVSVVAPEALCTASVIPTRCSRPTGEPGARRLGAPPKRCSR